MALKNKIHFDIDTLETISGTQGQAISTLESSASTAGSHISNTDNPHGVTPGQIGAVTAAELSNAIGAVVEALDWKEMVATFADLAIAYPEADEGWTASVAADNITYRYNGTDWVPILGTLSPLATANNNGLLSQQDFTKLGTIESGAQPDQNSAEVPYDNQASGLVSTNVKGALDELQFNKLDATALAGTIALYATNAPSDILEPSLRLVTSVDDAAYNTTPVNINTPAILGQGQLVGQNVSDPGVIVGNPGVITISTIGQIRKITGNANQNANFYYEVYRYDGLTQEVEATPIAISDNTATISSTSFQEFFAFAVFNNGTFGPLDRIVVRYFANQVENSGAVYQFQFGGTNPVRTLLPVPVTVIPAPNADLIVTDTATFAGQLSGADTTVQAALNTLDAHDHDTEYYTQGQLRPVAGDPEVDDFTTPAILDGRYLQTNAVGQTVQAFDTNTVVDANYATFDPSGTFASLRAQATTKADVDLGSVENFAISTQGEAQSGIVNNKYMTPLRTKEAILNLSPPTDLGPVEGRLDTIEGTGTGSITKALADANDYTDAEILSAQLNLGNNYSVNTIGERNALLNLAVGDIIFVADDGDGKWAQYKVTVVDPLAFLKVMDQDIFLNALSAPDVKASYESNANTNAFTDAEQSKLSGIETGAEVNFTNAEIKTAYESNADTNAFTDAEQNKLFDIETGAEVNLTDSEVKVAYENNTNTNAFTDALLNKLNNIETNAKDDQNATEVVYDPTAQTYALGANVQLALYAVDDELIAQDGRLDVIEGSGTGSIAKALADANDYTDAEILAAQLNLGNNYSVADITERNNLTNLAVGDIIFVADDGDLKFAQYKVTNLSPLSFLKVMDQDVLLNSISAANIKAAYESNADTNAFTNAEQSKLSGMAVDARKPIIKTITASAAGANWVLDTAGAGTPVTEDVTADFFFGNNDRPEGSFVSQANFTSLPPIDITFSSNATTGPVTITMPDTFNGDPIGGFSAKYRGAKVQVNLSNDPFTSAVYIISEVDNYTLTAFYDINQSANNGQLDPAALTFPVSGQGAVRFTFVDMNGRQQPGRAVASIGHFDPQNNTRYNAPGVVYCAAMETRYQVPNIISVTLSGVSEYIFDPQNNDSQAGTIRLFNIIHYDTNIAYVSSADGIRIVAKIENGQGFVNTATTYEDEDFQFRGEQPIAFLAMLASEELPGTNSLFIGENPFGVRRWDEATEFVSLSGVTEIGFAFGIGDSNEDDIAFTEGLVFEFTGLEDSPGLYRNDVVFGGDIIITPADVANALSPDAIVSLEFNRRPLNFLNGEFTYSLNNSFYIEMLNNPEVVGNNTLRMYIIANEAFVNSILIPRSIPLIMKVIK